MKKITEQPELDYARVCREFARKYGNRESLATPTAFRMIFAISPYVDYKGLIQLKRFQIRNLLGVTDNFLEITLQSAIESGFIENRDGSFYSLVHSFEKSDKYIFIPNYTRLVDGNFPKIGHWPTRLFAYIMGTRPTQGVLRVHIENLYRNKLHTADNGIDYFQSAEQVVAALVELLKQDLIEIKLPSKKKSGLIVLNHRNVSEHLSLLENHVEIHETAENSRKKKTRTSKLKYENDKHLLYIKLSASVTGDTTKVKASKSELDNVLKEYGYEVSLLRANTVKGIIGIKNELFRKSGEVGLAIYCNSLETYLENKSPILDIHDQKEFKLQSHFLNYYVLASVRYILLQIAKHIKTRSGVSKTESFQTVYGSLTLMEVQGLLNFYLDKSSANDLVVMEKHLYDLGISLVDLQDTSLAWSGIFDFANHVFAGLLEYHGVKLGKHELREFAYELATENLFTQKNKIETYLEKYRQTFVEYSGIAVGNGIFSGGLMTPPQKNLNSDKILRFKEFLENP